LNKILANIFFIFLLASSLGANEKVSLQLQWKHQFEFAGYYVAKELGFYSDEGFDVELRELEPSIIVYNEVANEKATFAVGRSSILIDISKGNELVLLAPIFQSSPSVLLSLKSANINSPKDLLGKRIMISQGIEYDVEFVAAFRDQGIDLINDTIIMEHSADINDLVKGKTDAIHAYLSNEPYTLKEKNIEYNIINPKNYGFDFYGDILFTSKKLLLENPEKVKRFRNASLKGWEWAFANIEQTVDIIYDKYNTQNKSKKALLFEAYELKKLAFYETNTIGTTDEIKLTEILNIYQNMGLIENNIDLKNVVYTFDSKPQEDKVFGDLNNPSSKLNFTEDELDYLKKKQVITMCIDSNWMPYESLKDGKHYGLSKEFMDNFEEKIGIPIKLVPTKNWMESIEYAKQRKCDIWSLAMETDERKEYMNFTKSYIQSPLVIATKYDKLFIANIEDVINTEKLGIVKGYAFEEIYKKRYPNNQLISVDSVKDGLNKVQNGEIYGLIDSLITIGYQLQNNYIGSLKIAGKFDDTWDLSIGVRNDDLTLLNIFNKVILSTDEKLQQDIINRWVNVVFEQRTDYSNIIRWIGFFFIIVLILAYRQYILGKYNKTLKLANSKIQEANEELHYLIDTMMESILIFEDKICIDCNYSALELFGCKSKDDLIGKSIEEFIEGDSFGIRFEDIDENQSSPSEINILSSNKNKIPVLMKFKNFNTKTKNIKIVAIFDLREIKEQNNKLKLAYLEISQKQEELYNLNHMLETRVKNEVESNLLKDKLLQQQTRLAQMGELISMIAHQWRQPLASIASCSIGIKLKIELEKYDLSSKDGQDEFLNYLMVQLNDIEKFSQNLTQTIDDFRDFYKPNKKLNFITIENVILKALDIIEVSLINSGIKIIKEFNANIEIELFQNEIMQVILNILKNSDDNFKERKIVNRIIKITTNIKDNGVELIIWDNGGGIKEEHLDKIFDPYFSTKDEGNGTGLGLYMSQVIVCEHHLGKLNVKNYDNGVGFILNLNKS
jgi:ABC-type nitrate/sulfonate/bicarbonate transport system substrate-binding protein/signal transduction histidine kinase/PAS domain-containing protein